MTIYADEAEKRRMQAQLSGGNTGLNTSGVVGGSTSSQIMQPTAKAPANSGFTNLDRYLDLNKGVGAGLASTANKGITDDVDKFGTDTTSTVSDLNTKFAESTKAAETAATGIKDGLTKDASENLAGAKSFVGSGYTGPTVGSTVATLGATKNDLNGRLEKVDDYGTVQSNLSKQYNYSDGFRDLDAFLMQGDKSGRDELAKIKGKTSDVNNVYNTAKKGLEGAEASGRTGYEGLQKGVKDSTAGIREKIKTGANARIGGYGSEAQGNVGFQGAGLGDVLSQAELDDIAALNDIGGLSAEEYAKSYKAGAPPPPPPPPPPKIDEAPIGTFQIGETKTNPDGTITLPDGSTTTQEVIDSSPKPTTTVSPYTPTGTVDLTGGMSDAELEAILGKPTPPPPAPPPPAPPPPSLEEVKKQAEAASKKLKIPKFFR